MEENLIIGCGFDQLVYTIDTREGTIRKKKSHSGPVLCLGVDNDYIVTGSEDKTIKIYDRRAGMVYKTVQVNVLHTKSMIL